jgi:hypothetical protein
LSPTWQGTRSDTDGLTNSPIRASNRDGNE